MGSFPFCFGNFLCGMSGVALNCSRGPRPAVLWRCGSPETPQTVRGCPDPLLLDLPLLPAQPTESEISQRFYVMGGSNVLYE